MYFFGNMRRTSSNVTNSSSSHGEASALLLATNGGGPDDEDSPGKTKPSATTTAKYALAPYPKASEIPPWGHSIFGMLWDRDPTPAALKLGYMVATALALLALYTMEYWLPYVISPDLDIRWDERNGIEDSIDHLHLKDTAKMLEQTLRMSPARLQGIFWFVVGVCGTIILADIMLANSGKSPTTTSNSSSSSSSSSTEDEIQKVGGHPWPALWRADNYVCYHDMFSEPARFGRVVRRPGNTFSNATYLFTALLVLSNTLQPGNNTSIFWITDAMFGLLILMLSVVSFLWHATNAPWTQYPDLWSMDCSILYLIVRYFCMAGIMILKTYTSVSEETAKVWMSGACFVVYAVIIGAIGNLQWGLFQAGNMHGTCPLSGRARLAGTSDVFGQGHRDLYVGADLCLFGVLPVLYLILPTLIQMFLVESVGSAMASKLTYKTLVIGWTYRLTDRWVLDNNPVMNWCNDKPTFFKRAVATFFSPTGVLHATTGITLLAGYAQTRSVEECM